MVKRDEWTVMLVEYTIVSSAKEGGYNVQSERFAEPYEGRRAALTFTDLLDLLIVLHFLIF
jgi:hypothetical protein